MARINNELPAATRELMMETYLLHTINECLYSQGGISERDYLRMKVLIRRRADAGIAQIRQGGVLS